MVYRAPFHCSVWAFTLCYAGLTFSCGAQGTLPAPARIRFDQDGYTLAAKDTSVPLRILIEPPPVSGLFSFGVRVTFDPAYAFLDPVLGARVEQTLNFSGAGGAGAIVEAGPGFIGVKGTLDVFAPALQPYLGDLLATINLQNQAEPGTSYRVGLEIFRTVGPTETVFVDGTGRALDTRLSFGFADILIAIPEPSLAVLGLLGGSLFLGLSSRGRRTDR